jgi:CRISPR-associated protein Csb2
MKIVIEIDFPAGRYHATPWGRNVNEGVVEWPPAPFRLARALIDVCHRRHPDWAPDRLAAVLRVLTNPPVYQLPPATAAHTRSFLSSNEKNPLKKQKVFDAFVAVDSGHSLRVGFEGEVAPETARDLAELTSDLNYFGRAESWVTMRVTEGGAPFDTNCVPAGTAAIRHGETVRVACLRPEPEFAELPEPPVVRTGKSARAKKLNPLTWVEAISLSTAELLEQGWSEPPAQKMVEYLQPADALKVRPSSRSKSLGARFRVARFSLHSKVLPRVTETVPFAERIRAHLMGIHRKVQDGDPAAVSWLFSGKEPDGKPAIGHQHAFIMPLDTDGDGRLDELVVQVGEAFDSSELTALDRLRSVWQPGGRPDVQLVLVALNAIPSAELCTKWVSATPFVTTRHHRKGRGPFDEWLKAEIRRECRLHDLPAPVGIDWTKRSPQQGHPYRWMEFVRSRKGDQPLPGHGCILTFAEPVRGPFTIGTLCHFGLGLFVPEQP